MPVLSPLLYASYLCPFANGQGAARITQDAANATLTLTLQDSPPTGQVSNLTYASLQGATISVLLKPLTSATAPNLQLSQSPTVAVGTTQIECPLAQADLTAAVAGVLYQPIVTVSFPSGEVGEFSGTGYVQIDPAQSSNTYFTYDTSTILGQTRYLAADTNPQTPIYADSELLMLLSLVGNSPHLAAAMALRASAASAARISVFTKLGQLGNDERQVYAALLAMAEALERNAPIAAWAVPPAAMFTIGDGVTTDGSMDLW